VSCSFVFEQNTGDMLLIILISFSIATVVYAVLGFVLLPYLKKRIAKSMLLRKGREAYAVVLVIEATGCYIDKLPQVRMLLKVQPYGRRNFVAETKQVVSPVEFSELRAGSSVKVKYNPHNVKEIAVIR
jgi:hypothetical protein